jgi:hypothetical protein
MIMKKIILLLLCFSMSQFAHAQRETKDQSQDNLSAMRADIKDLHDEQQKILTRLDELKRLLQPNGQQPPQICSIDVLA